jgi:hypothetical protein
VGAGTTVRRRSIFWLWAGKGWWVEVDAGKLGEPDKPLALWILKGQLYSH